MTRLTEQQREAAEAEGHVLVQAGPGTGKSTVLAEHAAHLIRKGAEPRAILVLTFTRSGAAGIREKVHEATGQEPACLTFDSYAYSVLRENLEKRSLLVATDLELETAIDSLYEGPARLPKHQHVGISKLRQAIRNAQSGRHEVHGQEAQVLATLSQRLEEAGRIGLFELVPQAVEALAENETQPYEHVLVDERQDVTPNEEFIAVHSGETVYSVGDVAQAIMQFRGATEGAFEALNPRRIALTASFRFGPEIAEAVNVVGRRIGVPDVVGLGPSSNNVVVVDIEPWEVAEECAVGIDGMILCPTNIECAHVAKQMPMADHIQDLQDGADPFAVAREFKRTAVSTIHKARGREADTVIVSGLDGVRSNADRMAYVALSRARRRLVVCESEARRRA